MSGVLVFAFLVGLVILEAVLEARHRVKYHDEPGKCECWGLGF